MRSSSVVGIITDLTHLRMLTLMWGWLGVKFESGELRTCSPQNFDAKDSIDDLRQDCNRIRSKSSREQVDPIKLREPTLKTLREILSIQYARGRA